MNTRHLLGAFQCWGILRIFPISVAFVTDLLQRNSKPVQGIHCLLITPNGALTTTTFVEKGVR